MTLKPSATTATGLVISRVTVDRVADPDPDPVSAGDATPVQSHPVVSAGGTTTEMTVAVRQTAADEAEVVTEMKDAVVVTVIGAEDARTTIAVNNDATNGVMANAKMTAEDLLVVALALLLITTAVEAPPLMATVEGLPLETQVSERLIIKLI